MLERYHDKPFNVPDTTPWIAWHYPDPISTAMTLVFDSFSGFDDRDWPDGWVDTTGNSSDFFNLTAKMLSQPAMETWTPGVLEPIRMHMDIVENWTLDTPVDLVVSRLVTDG